MVRIDAPVTVGEAPQWTVWTLARWKIRCWSKIQVPYQLAVAFFRWVHQMSQKDLPVQSELELESTPRNRAYQGYRQTLICYVMLFWLGFETIFFGHFHRWASGAAMLKESTSRSQGVGSHSKEKGHFHRRILFFWVPLPSSLLECPAKLLTIVCPKNRIQQLWCPSHVYPKKGNSKFNLYKSEVGSNIKTSPKKHVTQLFSDPKTSRHPKPS